MTTTYNSSNPPAAEPAGGERDRPQVPKEKIVASCPEWARRVISVFSFEMRRTKTPSRMLAWLVLVTFPVSIMALFRFNDMHIPEEEAWGFVLYGLVPQVVCLLGLLLWVASLLNSELEGKTWVYFSVRPGGKVAVLIGKYLNGVCWTISAGLLGLTLAMLVGQPDVSEPKRLYFVLCLLVIGSCFGYGSTFAVIGTLFPRRAMVISVAYTLVFEVLMSNVPALINQLTVQHRLFSILFKSMDWGLPSEAPMLIGQGPVWLHLTALVGYTAINLTLAGFVLRWREYATSEQNQ